MLIQMSSPIQESQRDSEDQWSVWEAALFMFYLIIYSYMDSSIFF